MINFVINLTVHAKEISWRGLLRFTVLIKDKSSHFSLLIQIEGKTEISINFTQKCTQPVIGAILWWSLTYID
jgi:hypothetical protein